MTCQRKCNFLFISKAEVKNEGQQALLLDPSISHLEEGYWLGGSDLLSEGTWIWDSDSSPITYTAWGVGEPTGSPIENCIAITKNHSHYWSDEDCLTTLQRPLCEMGDANLKCPRLFEYAPQVDRCYHYGTEKDKYFNFDEAFAQCERLGVDAYMVQIETEAEMDAIWNLTGIEPMGIFYWMAARDDAVETEFRWIITNEPLTYNNWKYPLEADTDKNCAYWLTDDDHYWINTSCYSQMNLLCECDPLT